MHAAYKVSGEKSKGRAASPLAAIARSSQRMLNPADLHRRAGFVHAVESEMDNRRGGLDADVLQQRVGLLELLASVWPS